MAIQGKKRESGEDFGKKIGMVEVEVIAINPSVEEFKEVLGRELDENSKMTEYLGESRDGNNYCRVDFWLQQKVAEGESAPKFKVSFFLEDKVRQNQDETKQQFINDIGVCSWASDPEDLPEWFAKREFRAAKSGEEDFYGLLRSWVSLNYREDDTVLQLEWKNLMKGNVDELKALIGDDLVIPFLAMATVSIKEGDEEGEVKEYQGIYTKGFLPSFTMRHFNLIDYSNPEVIAKLELKPNKDLKIHERFVKNVTGEYGCKDIYSLKALSDYIAEEHIVASDDAMTGSADADTDAEY